LLLSIFFFWGITEISFVRDFSWVERTARLIFLQKDSSSSKEVAAAGVFFHPGRNLGGHDFCRHHFTSTFRFPTTHIGRSVPRPDDTAFLRQCA
jgi:hypothetical protein